MKIRLEEAAVNISNLTGGKNVKARRRDFTWKTLVRFIYFFQGTMNGNQNNWICDMSTRGFLIEILLHIYHAVDWSNLWLFIYFDYSQLMRTFTRNFNSYIMHIQTSFLTIMNITTLKIIHPITFRIIKSNQSKCCEIKITSCKHATFLYNSSPHSIWIFLYGMYFIA